MWLAVFIEPLYKRRIDMPNTVITILNQLDMHLGLFLDKAFY